MQRPSADRSSPRGYRVPEAPLSRRLGFPAASLPAHHVRRSAPHFRRPVRWIMRSHSPVIKHKAVPACLFPPESLQPGHLAYGKSAFLGTQVGPFCRRSGLPLVSGEHPLVFAGGSISAPCKLFPFSLPCLLDLCACFQGCCTDHHNLGIIVACTSHFF